MNVFSQFTRNLTYRFFTILYFKSYWIPFDNHFDIAGNESCPQPQTSEHLAAIEIMKLKHIIILQNKIDLVKESQAKDQYDQILKFIQGTKYLLVILEGHLNLKKSFFWNVKVHIFDVSKL